MGIDAELNSLLCREAEARPFSGALLTLGVQRIALPGRQVGDVEYFKELGFSEVQRLDISNYEGADYIVDLNDRSGVFMLMNFDCVFDGGVLEHVFDVPAALQNIFRHLKIGGRIIHQVACNNYVDHGFYQICPRMLKAYYEVNKFEVLCLERVQGGDLLHCVVRKSEQSTCGVVPQQVF